MSAYIAQRKNDCVVIMSDAAHYDKHLVIRRIASKVDDLGHFNGVMVSRGDMDVCGKLLNGVRIIFNAASTFDIAVAALSKELERLNVGGDQRPLEFILAGLSETGGPSLFAFTNRKVEGMEPFVFHKVENVIQCGFIPGADQIAAFEAKGGIDGLGLQLMEMMRQTESEPLVSGGRKGYIVGGFVERVDITADGISRAVVKSWRDQVGQPINPASFETIAA